MLLNRGIPFKYILSKIKTEILYVLAIGVVVSYITSRLKFLIPEIPLAIPTFLGTAISVILSFKLNQSYDRWWEARKIWGNIVNDSRNLILQLQSFLSDQQQEIVSRMGRRQIAWCYALGRALRALDPMEDLERHLSVQDLNYLQRHSNKPLGIIQLNVLEVKTLKENNRLDVFSFVQLNNTIAQLVNYMGMAERIKSTVFPVTYRLFLHMLIYLFVATLSISLQEMEVYFEIPLLLIIASFFFLLERTATNLQDPFSNKPTDTAMNAIANTIETNIKQLLNEKDVPLPIPMNTFYIK